jgi:hypothetical protein
MGSLAWDEGAFPNPAGTLKRFRDTYGTQAIVIEESYLARYSDGYARMAERQGMARNPGTNDPTIIDYNPWWGVGEFLLQSVRGASSPL